MNRATSQTRDGQETRETFASWSEFMDAMRAVKSGADYSGYARRDAWFLGTETWQEAVDVATAGYQPAEVVANRPVPRVGMAQTWGWTDDPSVGLVVDVPMMLSGEPAHWLTQRYSPRPALRVLVNTGALQDVDEEQFLRRGRYVYALVLALCESYRVEVWAVARALSRLCYGETRVCLKPQDMPLDPGTLGFAACHRAYHRRFTFSRRATYPGFSNDTMGATQELQPELPGDIVTPSGNADIWKSDKTAQAWLDSVLAGTNSTGVAA